VVSHDKLRYFTPARWLTPPVRFPRRNRDTRPPRGEFPPSFTRGWLRLTLPSASPAEARAVLERMRQRGWTEEEVAELILPYMPRSKPGRTEVGARAVGPPAVPVPAQVSTAWLDQQLPAMDRKQIRLVVEELERRGWPPTKLAVAVLPHLLPKLPAEDANAILAGLEQLGMTEDEIARLRPSA
jgi:hypothetical protein